MTAPPTDGGARRSFPPTAAKLLTAARRVLVRKGYQGFTMQAVERESGVNRALVHYYFGSKAGLLEAVVDTLFEDPDFGYSDVVANTLEGPARAQALLDWLGRIAANRRAARLLYELLPHVLRSRKLRGRMAELYAAYRRFDGDCLAPDATSDVGMREDLGALSVAVVEGLTIQATVDPGGFQRDRAYALWKTILTHYLRDGTPHEEVQP